MKRSIIATAIILAWGLTNDPASAQVMVYDAKNYAGLIKQASTALDQLNTLKAQVGQAKALYDGFNTSAGAGSIARQLAAPALRAFIPSADAYLSSETGDLRALGEIGEKAKALRQASRLYTPSPSDAAGLDLEKAGDRAALDLAMGQQVATVGARRLEGLQQLAAALGTASSVRDVVDIQARLAAEQVMVSNDQMRLSGLMMAQEAQARLQAQRDQERARAASDARLAIFRRGLP